MRSARTFLVLAAFAVGVAIIYRGTRPLQLLPPAAPASDEAPPLPLAQPLSEADRATLRGAFDGANREATNSIGMVFRRVSPGWTEFKQTFGRGTWKVGSDRPFYLGVCEVTQEQYERVTGMNPSRFRGRTRPVESIEWVEAKAFCQKLSELEGLDYRLPTETEWEYACRAGCPALLGVKDTPEVLGEHTWHEGNSGGRTHAVGEKRPNAWGFHDMLGNVWEWCLPGPPDVRVPDENSRDGRSTGRSRLLRGGSWCSRADFDLIGTDYYWFAPVANRMSGYGFRVAKPLP